MKIKNKVIIPIIAIILLFTIGVAIQPQAKAGVTSSQVERSKEEIEFRQSHPEFGKLVDDGRLTPDGFAKIVNFSTEHPRLMKAIQKDRIPFEVFRLIGPGHTNNADRNALLMRYEAREISTAKLVRKLSDGVVNSQVDCGDCSFLTDVYVAGCLRGSGDMFFCFFLGEQYLCVCERALCGTYYPDGCGEILILW